MRRQNGPSTLLRRMPRFRRALRHLRAFAASSRRAASRRGAPARLALAVLLGSALFATLATGGLSGAFAAPSPAAATASPDLSSAASGGARPSSAAATPGAPSGPLPSVPAASVSPGAPSDPAAPPGPSSSATGAAVPQGLGAGFGTYCGTSSQGERDLAPLRAQTALESTALRFADHLDALVASLSGTPYAFADLSLDPSAGTRAFVFADSVAGAENLNGYFYFLYDPNASRSGLAPLVLVVDKLFEEDERGRATSDRTFATPAVEDALRAAFDALFGAVEGKRAADFATGIYRAVFSARVDGAPPVETRRYLALPSTTVVFQDSYMTYVEFLPGGAP